MHRDACHAARRVMLESELFAFLEGTADAAFTVTESGEIRSWNGAAARLFGYDAASVIGRNVEEVFDARDDLETAALAGGTDSAARRWNESAGGIPSFDLEVRTMSGARIWINVSTIVFDSRRTGRRLFVRLARDVTAHRRRETLAERLVHGARQLIALADDATPGAPVAVLSEQERRILRLLAQGRSAALIARRLDISAQTLRNHLHRINRKLRTHSRLEAVTHALRRGLLD
jgi:PAS domain S-box-containing protein